ncbi:hypothetical protein ACOMHN_003645 [Nucella lapillus]
MRGSSSRSGHSESGGARSMGLPFTAQSEIPSRSRKRCNDESEACWARDVLRVMEAVCYRPRRQSTVAARTVTASDARHFEACRMFSSEWRAVRFLPGPRGN